MSAKEFFNLRKQQYKQNNCLLQPDSRAEHNKLTAMDPDPDPNPDLGDVTSKKYRRFLDSAASIR